MWMRDTMIVQFIQNRLDPGLGLSTSVLCNAHSAAMRRQAQQDYRMARREAADPIEGNEFGIASIAGLPAQIPNRSRQMGTHNF